MFKKVPSHSYSRMKTFAGSWLMQNWLVVNALRWQLGFPTPSPGLSPISSKLWSQSFLTTSTLHSMRVQLYRSAVTLYVLQVQSPSWSLHTVWVCLSHVGIQFSIQVTFGLWHVGVQLVVQLFPGHSWPADPSAPSPSTTASTSKTTTST